MNQSSKHELLPLDLPLLLKAKNWDLFRQYIAANSKVVHQKDQQQWTLLHHAVHCGAPAVIVTELLALGADLSLTNTEGLRADELNAYGIPSPALLHLIDIKATMIRTIANGNLKWLNKHVLPTPCWWAIPLNPQQETALHLAIRFNKPTVALAIIQHMNAPACTNLRNKVLNQPDHNGDTPLHVAVAQGLEKVMHSLLENGANIGLENKQHQRADQLNLGFLQKNLLHVEKMKFMEAISKGDWSLCLTRIQQCPAWLSEDAISSLLKITNEHFGTALIELFQQLIHVVGEQHVFFQKLFESKTIETCFIWLDTARRNPSYSRLYHLIQNTYAAKLATLVAQQHPENINAYFLYLKLIRDHQHDDLYNSLTTMAKNNVTSLVAVLHNQRNINTFLLYLESAQKYEHAALYQVMHDTCTQAVSTADTTPQNRQNIEACVMWLSTANVQAKQHGPLREAILGICKKAATTAAQQDRLEAYFLWLKSARSHNEQDFVNFIEDLCLTELSPAAKQQDCHICFHWLNEAANNSQAILYSKIKGICIDEVKKDPKINTLMDWLSLAKRHRHNHEDLYKEISTLCVEEIQASASNKNIEECFLWLTLAKNGQYDQLYAAMQQTCEQDIQQSVKNLDIDTCLLWLRLTCDYPNEHPSLTTFVTQQWQNISKRFDEYINNASLQSEAQITRCLKYLVLVRQHTAAIPQIEPLDSSASSVQSATTQQDAITNLEKDCYAACKKKFENAQSLLDVLICCKWLSLAEKEHVDLYEYFQQLCLNTVKHAAEQDTIDTCSRWLSAVHHLKLNLFVPIRDICWQAIETALQNNVDKYHAWLNWAKAKFPVFLEAMTKLYLHAVTTAASQQDIDTCYAWLMGAARYNDFELFKQLAKIAHPLCKEHLISLVCTTTDPHGKTALHYVAEHQAPEFLAYLIHFGSKSFIGKKISLINTNSNAYLGIKNKIKIPLPLDLLHHALTTAKFKKDGYNSETTIQLLLQHGASVAALNSEGIPVYAVGRAKSTILNNHIQAFEHAVHTADINCIRAFVDHNADWWHVPLALPPFHKTPLTNLYAVVQCNSVPLLKFVLQYTATQIKLGIRVSDMLNKVDQHTKHATHEWTLLHCATSAGAVDCVEYLLAHGADVNAQLYTEYDEFGESGRTALHLATILPREKNGYQITQLLLSYDADLTLTLANGHHPDQITPLLETHGNTDPMDNIMTLGQRNPAGLQFFVTRMLYQPNWVRQAKERFHHAIELGDIDTIEEFLQQNITWLKIPLNATKQCALHVIAEKNESPLINCVSTHVQEWNRRHAPNRLELLQLNTPDTTALRLTPLQYLSYNDNSAAWKQWAALTHLPKQELSKQEVLLNRILLTPQYNNRMVEQLFAELYPVKAQETNIPIEAKKKTLECLYSKLQQIVIKQHEGKEKKFLDQLFSTKQTQAVTDSSDTRKIEALQISPWLLHYIKKANAQKDNHITGFLHRMRTSMEVTMVINAIQANPQILDIVLQDSSAFHANPARLKSILTHVPLAGLLHYDAHFCACLGVRSFSSSPEAQSTSSSSSTSSANPRSSSNSSSSSSSNSNSSFTASTIFSKLALAFETFGVQTQQKLEDLQETKRTLGVLQLDDPSISLEHIANDISEKEDLLQQLGMPALSSSSSSSSSTQLTKQTPPSHDLLKAYVLHFGLLGQQPNIEAAIKHYEIVLNTNTNLLHRCQALWQLANICLSDDHDAEPKTRIQFASTYLDELIQVTNSYLIKNRQHHPILTLRADAERLRNLLQLSVHEKSFGFNTLAYTKFYMSAEQKVRGKLEAQDIGGQICLGAELLDSTNAGWVRHRYANDRPSEKIVNAEPSGPGYGF